MKKTDWMEVARAAMSTSSSRIDERDQALVAILERFKLPLTGIFRKQLGKFSLFDQELAQDMFHDFSLYILENRKKIFRQANPEKGKLRNFIITIALRFFHRNVRNYIKKDISLSSEVWNIQKETREMEKIFEVEYVNNLISTAMKELKEKDTLPNKAMYYMFRKKFFTKEIKGITALDLARDFEEISTTADIKAIKKAEDRVNQRISKAKNIFRQCLFRQIRRVLVISEKESIPQEEIDLFCKYVHWVVVD